MDKINKITTDGNNNIVLQDITGNDITININDTKAIEKLIADHSDKINVILDLLKQSKEPALQQFAEQIYNIQQINNSNFNAHGATIDIRQAQNVTISKIEENRVTKYVKYVLLFFILPAAFLVLLYWYFALSKPFSTTVSIKEAKAIAAIPFKEGTLTIQYGDKTETQVITGEVIFKQIPANLKNTQAKMVFKAKGYNTIDTSIVLCDNIVLPIHRDNSLGVIFGTVKDENNIPVSDVQITVLDIAVKTDNAGKFLLNIPLERQQEEQRLTAYKKGFQIWEYTFPVLKDIETKIILKK